MTDKKTFLTTLSNSYSFKGSSVLLGSAVYKDDPETGFQVKIPLRTLNRHGLIAGATGTGKTKSLQVLAEELSASGVPVLMLDVKGDLSGIARPGTMNPIIEKRSQQIGIKWAGRGFSVELMTISGEPGVKLKATISEFGPVLLAKILELNENQAGGLAMLFKFCDDKRLPLLDIDDLKAVIKYVQAEGKDEFEKNYGFFHSTSAGTIMRNIISLEQQGAGRFFGEPSFEIDDLMRRNEKGEGIINILRVTDIQSNTTLFSTFMLCLLAEIFQKMPEKGDVEKPELVIFLDEAHLIFRNATQTLLNQFETTVKLIRSKGVGIILITQSPDDIPAEILGQLGLKVQHALRAFTANDRKAIKSAAENYPLSDYYKIDELITQLGIGEALVTALDEKGRPTELVHTLMRSPYSRMDILSPDEIDRTVGSSELAEHYNRDINRESAYEILNHRIKEREEDYRDDQQQQMEREPAPRSRGSEKTVFEEVMKSPITNTIAREVTRGLLGVLGLRTTRSRSSYSSSRSRGFRF
jgi:uncharacterized protein